MADNSQKIYVGCALSQASEEFRAAVEAFKEKLRANGHDVYDFVGLVKGSETDVYNWDIGECVTNCAAFVAICDLPSLGLGMEMDRAIMLKKPTLAVAHTNAIITRLLLGAAQVEPNVEFQRYDDLLRDVPAMVDKLMAGL